MTSEELLQCLLKKECFSYDAMTGRFRPNSQYTSIRNPATELGSYHKRTEQDSFHFAYKQAFPDCNLYLVEKSCFPAMQMQDFHKSIPLKKTLQVRFPFLADTANTSASGYLYFPPHDFPSAPMPAYLLAEKMQ